MPAGWVGGNWLSLLENGEEFFPRVTEVLRNARSTVFLETFILQEDRVGRALGRELIAAAKRGVRVEVTVDAWGSRDLSQTFLMEGADAGVCFHLYDEGSRRRTGLGWFRRMHRKLIVVDGERALIGGINFAEDHLADSGPESKQDYAVEVAGPIVAEMQRFAIESIASVHGVLVRGSATSRVRGPGDRPDEAGDAECRFVTRDNARRRDAIERLYRAAIRGARSRVWIANAYFLPGFGLMREIQKAARRGVDVRLVLQGRPDLPLARLGATLLYESLLGSGVRIFEYCERAFHGKIAVVDGRWSTVGSSNLDPASLALNLEANLFVRDVAFTRTLSERLERLMAERCEEIRGGLPTRRTLGRSLATALVFHFMRLFPRWALWVPSRPPPLTRVVAIRRGTRSGRGTSHQQPERSAAARSVAAEPDVQSGGPGDAPETARGAPGGA